MNKEKSLIDLRPPGFAVGFVSVLYTLVGLFSIFGTDDASAPKTVGSIFLVIGVGLWLKFQWARWAAVVLNSLILLLIAYRFFMTGEFTEKWYRPLLFIWIIYIMIEWDVYGKNRDGEG